MADMLELFYPVIQVNNHFEIFFFFFSAASDIGSLIVKVTQIGDRSQIMQQFLCYEKICGTAHQHTYFPNKLITSICLRSEACKDLQWAKFGFY
jgi:hypothetical protein